MHKDHVGSFFFGCKKQNLHLCGQQFVFHPKPLILILTHAIVRAMKETREWSVIIQCLLFYKTERIRVTQDFDTRSTHGALTARIID